MLVLYAHSLLLTPMILPGDIFAYLLDRLGQINAHRARRDTDSCGDFLYGTLLAEMQIKRSRQIRREFLIDDLEDMLGDSGGGGNLFMGSADIRVP